MVKQQGRIQLQPQHLLEFVGDRKQVARVEPQLVEPFVRRNVTGTGALPRLHQALDELLGADRRAGQRVRVFAGNPAHVLHGLIGGRP